MKRFQYIFSLLILIFLNSCNYLPPGQQITEFCGHMNEYEKRIEIDQNFVNNLERIERLTENYINKLKEEKNTNFRTTLFTIPVVVHVVYKNSTENISNAQVQSQIDALNNVFRLANTDASTIPAAFQGLATDVLIEFTLAQRDPNCNPTNGITRTSTTETSFPYNPLSQSPQNRNPIKFDSSGGKDGWPSDQYLNFWVGDIVTSSNSDGLAGYASFPADLTTRPDEDGVVMDYTFTGTSGTVVAPFNLGRVAAHEVGHWLNLKHIGGDDCGGPASWCLGSDCVDDTPNQQCQNTGCPTFPLTDACTQSSPGVMFMNHMDYTSDACRRMFTIGQSDRMSATLYEVRNSLLGSQGAIPPAAVVGEDLWMKDTDEDLGDEPNTNSTVLYLSDDIWVRNNNDGVRNRGCNPSSNANLKLYWAKASPSLSWPQPWDGTVNSPYSPFPVMGNLIGTQSITAIGGNDFQIFTFQWNGSNVPLPSSYAGFGGDKAHFCLLARIESSPTSPFGMTSPETNTLWQNVVNNNNIVWKNVNINEINTGGFSSVVITNYSKKPIRATLEFNFLKSMDKNINIDSTNIFDLGKFEVTFSEELFEIINKAGPKMISGLEYIDGTKYRILSPIAKIKRILLEPKKYHIADILFTPNRNKNIGRWLINLNILQLNYENNQIYGGQEFKFIKG